MIGGNAEDRCMVLVGEDIWELKVFSSHCFCFLIELTKFKSWAEGANGRSCVENLRREQYRIILQESDSDESTPQQFHCPSALRVCMGFVVMCSE